jgi:hypothetical protein
MNLCPSLPICWKFYVALMFIKSAHPCYALSSKLEDIMNGKQVRLFKADGRDLLKGFMPERETEK